MAASMNKVTLLGNLARDPDVRHSNEGSKIVTLSVATSEQWRDKNTGEKKERAEFHRVVIFNERLADVAEQYLKKGRKVYVEGQLQTRKWTDASGQDRYATEVVLGRYRGELLLLDRGDGGSFDRDASKSAAQVAEGRAEFDQGTGGASSELSALDDDIPF
ncbi:single-stranded DNA-binding protein [Candidatus Hepatobacter penaei]|uniref:single-stranded DNA-binding protein n=1 Tax=Candidatus Hepatobacter penaei TaxID=1274402 RepID=UPI0004F32D46|nr:single-stranded DNA-binding protein [Candidatus Hepatobacter penaei]